MHSIRSLTKSQCLGQVKDLFAYKYVLAALREREVARRYYDTETENGELVTWVRNNIANQSSATEIFIEKKNSKVEYASCL